MPRRPERKKRRGQRDLSLPNEEHRWEVGKDEHGKRLDLFLVRRIPWRSREGIQALVGEGAVEVLPFKDPQKATVGVVRDGLRLRTGQEVVLTVAAPVPATGPIGADPGDLEVVFEDEHLLAVGKPPDLAVHPSKGHQGDSLVHRVHARHKAVWGDTPDMPTLCHRLDRETSGLVLLAKDQLSRTRIGRQFERRKVEKRYLALVRGNPPQDQGEVDLPMGKALNSAVRLRMGVREDGQVSKTGWKVLRRFSDMALVELRPFTGRQHQLRVHLAHFGHPILGDKLYLGGEDVFLRSLDDGMTAQDWDLLGMSRQALHSWKLEIEHPFTGRALSLVCPLARDICDHAGIEEEEFQFGGLSQGSLDGFPVEA